MQKEVEKHFTRGEIRRVAAREVGGASYPARVSETYATDLLSTIDVGSIRARKFRLVVDYGFSAASYVLPLVLGPLEIEVIAAHAFPSDEGSEGHGLAASIGQAKRLVSAVGADLGAVFDRAAERLYLIDEQAHEVPVELALLLYLSLIGSSSNGHAGKLAFPVTVTRQVDRLVENTSLEIVRTAASLQALTQAATEEGVIFAGAVGGGYVFPEFLPGYDAVASLVKLLELLAPVGRPLSELVGELPRPTLVHRTDPVPVGDEGPCDAAPERALRRPARRPDRRDQGLRGARLGAGAARPRRARDPPLRRGRHARGLRRARRRAADDRRGDRAGRGRGSANLKPGSRLAARKG